MNSSTAEVEKLTARHQAWKRGLNTTTAVYVHIFLCSINAENDTLTPCKAPSQSFPGPPDCLFTMTPSCKTTAALSPL